MMLNDSLEFSSKKLLNQRSDKKLPKEFNRTSFNYRSNP